MPWESLGCHAIAVQVCLIKCYCFECCIIFSASPFPGTSLRKFRAKWFCKLLPKCFCHDASSLELTKWDFCIFRRKRWLRPLESCGLCLLTNFIVARNEKSVRDSLISRVLMAFSFSVRRNKRSMNHLIELTSLRKKISKMLHLIKISFPAFNPETGWRKYRWSSKKANDVNKMSAKVINLLRVKEDFLWIFLLLHRRFSKRTEIKRKPSPKRSSFRRQKKTFHAHKRKTWIWTVLSLISIFSGDRAWNRPISTRVLLNLFGRGQGSLFFHRKIGWLRKIVNRILNKARGFLRSLHSVKNK